MAWLRQQCLYFPICTMMKEVIQGALQPSTAGTGIAIVGRRRRAPFLKDYSSQLGACECSAPRLPFAHALASGFEEIALKNKFLTSPKMYSVQLR